MYPMDRLPPLNAVRVFEAAARHENFNRAAEDLHVTPSAVSHQIRLLEEHLDSKLFSRAGRRVTLTPAGREFLPAVRDALYQIQQAAQRIAEASVPDSLTITVAPAFAYGWLLPRLAKFQFKHPNIEVRIITSISLTDFEGSDVDIGIRTGTGDWPDMMSHQILTEEPILVCSPGYSEGPTPLRRPEDLHGVTLIHNLPRMGQWRSWLNAVGLEGIDPDAGPKFSNAAGSIEAAVSGLGVAITDRRMVEAHLRDHRLIIPFETELPSESGYYLVYPEDRADDPHVTIFRDWILSEAAVDDEAALNPELDELALAGPNDDFMPSVT